MRKRIIGSLMTILVLGVTLIFVGNAAAQHTGGTGESRIPLNLASVSQLQKIDGVTARVAKSIVEYRKTSGFFKKAADLKNVPGVTTTIYRKMDPQVGAEGDLYCVGVESEDDWDEDDEDIPLAPSKC
ncbi:MAG: helix-hairpin-helix domain-containing protein [Deltaproteobacteria bacterium]|nr:helix-hairpin-helix domain-containing protein [Deltaproteobacteria bacterium]MBW1913970.1 helix-hairpin-helix domain-containing protein [Deltaproteobacteria bacterium]